MGEDYCVGCGDNVSCTEVRARVVFATCDGVVSLSLRSSLGLTFFRSLFIHVSKHPLSLQNFIVKLR